MFSPPEQLVYRMNKPRRSHFQDVELYVIHDGTVYFPDGEIVTLEEMLLERLPNIKRGFCISRNSPIEVKRIVDLMNDNPAFNARLRLSRRTRQGHRDTDRKVTTESLMVGFYGLYRNPEHKRRGYAVRHIVLDPDTFLRLPKHARPYIPDTPAALMQFGETLIKWCEANDMPVVSSGVQIASALLKDKRFLVAPLRKIPSATNRKARHALTGHMFKTTPNLRAFPYLFRLDQRASHHRCTLELSFPHPDHLFGRGYFRTLRKTKWTDYRYLEEHHGLIYARCEVTKLSPFFPQLQRFGRRHYWLTTNEIPYLLAEGLRIEHVIAAWTSTETDATFNRYAAYALKETQNTADSDKWWKKPLLLSPYGLLGVKTDFPSVQANTQPRPKATPRQWHIGGGESITVYPVPSVRRCEPAFTNVIARAMIERESRARTAELATALDRAKWEVVMVDADAVMVHPKGNELPEHNPEYWKLTRLDDVTMQGPNLVSNQVVKLPGIPGTYRERYVSNMRRLSKPQQERLNV